MVDSSGWTAAGPVGRAPVPVIDLFAGPGGLGEGFSAVNDADGRPSFKLALSIEKDPAAHQTLTLRSVFRRLRACGATDAYYAYMRGELTSGSFRSIPLVAEAFTEANEEARRVELGKFADRVVDDMITHALAGAGTWVLIGGPPCQAYSVVGRARRTNDRSFEKDEKHLLYRQYLRVIGKHQPTLFVMENVRGMLSSKLGGELIFKRILRDLSMPAPGLEYEIRSFVRPGPANTLDPADYLIHAARFGIPQRRDRVILLGVRKGGITAPHRLLTPAAEPITVKQAIGALPRIRSRVSSGDTPAIWRQILEAAPVFLRDWDAPPRERIAREMAAASDGITLSTGGRFIATDPCADGLPPGLREWTIDPAIGGICQHEARAHQASDLARYLFASAYASVCRMSPSLRDFPLALLPAHENLKDLREGGRAPFEDRFRVQCAGEPATTVVSHIAKDGHYFIHYEPSQCRSLTVREAARLQTFPDNYLFEGNRTQQYTQVGNAVPPLLAFRLGEIVRDLVGGASHGDKPTYRII